MLLIFYNFFMEDYVVSYNTIKYKDLYPKNLDPEWTAMKKILFYTPFFSRNDYSFGFGHEPFLNNNCSVSNCITTNNKKLLNSISEFDAILFHARDLDLTDLPISRNINQYYIMFEEESPLMDSYPVMEFLKFDSPPYKSLNEFFNWTMTYRKNSDFYVPYGWIAPKNWSRNTPAPKHPIEWTKYYIEGTE